MKNMKRTVLITGASKGIGRALAELFAKEGYNLILVARSKQLLDEIKIKLEAQYDTNVEVVIKDLSQDNAAECIYREISLKNINVDILVNNAGFGDFGEFHNSNWDKQRMMVQVNVLSLMNMTRLFIKPMIERGYGKILNVASIAAFQPGGPLMAVYYATKAFVLSFSEALSKELEGTGVTVTALCPGPTKTDFEQAASMTDSRLFNTLKVAAAEEVAIHAYKGLLKGKPVVVHGFINKLLVFGIRFVPRNIVRRVVYIIQNKKE